MNIFKNVFTKRFGLPILISGFLMLFLWPSSALAVHPPNDLCVGEAVEADEKQVIFGITNHLFKLDKSSNPSDERIQHWICMAVPEEAVSVPFDELTSRFGLIAGPAAENYRVARLISRHDTRTGGIRSTSRQERKAVEWQYELSRGTEDGNYFDRIVYSMKHDGIGKNINIYYLGDHAEGRVVSYSVKWKQDGKDAVKGYVEIPHGATKTITLNATPKVVADGTVEATCPKCGDYGNAVRFEVRGGGSFGVTFDTKELVDRLRLAVPAEFKLDLDATTGAFAKKSKFEIVLTILSFDCSKFKGEKDKCDGNSKCFFHDSGCFNKRDTQVCPTLLTKKDCGKSTICQWFDKHGEGEAKCVSPVQSHQIQTQGAPAGYKGPLPACAWSGTCRNINSLVEVVINYGKLMFTFVGSLALVMFVYGGFMMIFSMGNAERAKKGRDVLIAAVVGLIIVFTAYLLVDLLLDALGVTGDFRAIKISN